MNGSYWIDLIGYNVNLCNGGANLTRAICCRQSLLSPRTPGKLNPRKERIARSLECNVRGMQVEKESLQAIAKSDCLVILQDNLYKCQQKLSSTVIKI